MMYIDQTGSPTRTWHVGEPMPEIRKRVISFQVDGDGIRVGSGSYETEFNL